MESEAYQELYEQEPIHWWYRGMRYITTRLLQYVICESSRLQILDAGCGVGGNLSALSKRGVVSGIDVSPLALAFAAINHCQRIAQATVERLPFADNTFDLVTSFDVLYHAQVTDDSRALREFSRVLRPGGYLLIRLPALPALRGPHDVVVHGKQRYTTAMLNRLVRGAGLMPIRLTYLNSLLFPLIFVSRRLQSVTVQFGAKPESDVKGRPSILSAVLYRLLTIEGWWIARGGNFPLGVSVLCLAVKPT